MADWKKIVLASGTASQYIKGDGTFGTYSTGLPLTGGTVSGNIKIDQGSASSNPRLTFAHDNIGTNHYIEMDRSSDYMKVVVNGGIATIIDSNQSSTFYGAINSSMSSTSVLGNLRNTHASGYGLKIQATDANSARYIATFNDKDDNVKAQIKGDGSAIFGGDVTIGSNELIFDAGEKVFSTGGYVVADGDAGFIARDSGVNKLIINH